MYSDPVPGSDAWLERWYFKDGTPYCFNCVESYNHPCMSEDERQECERGSGVGSRCACCGERGKESN
jgi:hypothetical protein